MSYLFIGLAIYAGYKLIKGGYVSITLPAQASGAATTLSRVLAFLKSVF